MDDSDASEHWWQEPGEQILHQAECLARYQYVESVMRRRLPATFFLTDQRIVASRKRGKTEKQKILPMDVPLDKLQTVAVRHDLQGQGSYYRPFPGRRVLRLEIDHMGRVLVLGLALKTAMAGTWLDTITELRPDIEVPVEFGRS